MDSSFNPRGTIYSGKNSYMSNGICHDLEFSYCFFQCKLVQCKVSLRKVAIFFLHAAVIALVGMAESALS